MLQRQRHYGLGFASSALSIGTAEVCWQQKAADLRALTGATRDEKARKESKEKGRQNIGAVAQVPSLDALLETDGMQRRAISRAPLPNDSPVDAQHVQGHTSTTNLGSHAGAAYGS